ncbi:hypothetical protein DW121_08515 [Bacteroides sp. AM10-21B]|nr:hypothetical protein DW121_08515 [Bacteroides sp. AM10-21B]
MEATSFSRSNKKKLYREASTIKYFVFLKFDVAKLKSTRKKNKKIDSTANLTKQLKINQLQMTHLYNTTIEN